LKNTGIKVTALYVMDLPPSNAFDRPYANAGLQQLLKNAAREAFEKFLTEFADRTPFTLAEVIVDNTFNNTARHISNFAQTQDADMVIMGAQGHSNWENLWFGSVTEKVVETANCPVLVVR
jgi:nucleotide-binding universal stress UspA family protein